MYTSLWDILDKVKSLDKVYSLYRVRKPKQPLWWSAVEALQGCCTVETSRSPEALILKIESETFTNSLVSASHFNNNFTNIAAKVLKNLPRF